MRVASEDPFRPPVVAFGGLVVMSGSRESGRPRELVVTLALTLWAAGCHGSGCVHETAARVDAPSRPHVASAATTDAGFGDDLDGVTLPAMVAVTGTREMFNSGPQIAGLSSVDDHGTRRIDDDRFEVLLNASTPIAIEQLRQAGFTVRLVMTSEQRKAWLRGIAARQFAPISDRGRPPRSGTDRRGDRLGGARDGSVVTADGGAP